MNETKTCSVDGCGRRSRARGWCAKHYHRWRTLGAPDAAVRRERPRGLSLPELARWIGGRLVPRGACLFRPDGANDYWAIGYRGKSVAAHRIILLAAAPPPFARAEARHLCGNPGCCRLDHLAWGSHADNMADMVRHGRSTPGERHAKARLNPVAVRVARLLRRRGVPIRRIVRAYGISHAAISNATNGKTWAGVRDAA